MFDEEERLRILERVSKGELTPEEGQLQIAMLKVKGQRTEPAVAEPPGQEQAPPRAPNLAPLVGLLALPIALAVGFVAVALAFMLALPTYVLVSLWNGQLAPAVQGLPLLGFWPTLAGMVLFMMVTGALRFRRSLRVSLMGVRGGEQ